MFSARWRRSSCHIFRWWSVLVLFRYLHTRRPEAINLVRNRLSECTRLFADYLSRRWHGTRGFCYKISSTVFLRFGRFFMYAVFSVIRDYGRAGIIAGGGCDVGNTPLQSPPHNQFSPYLFSAHSFAYAAGRLRWHALPAIFCMR